LTLPMPMQERLQLAGAIASIVASASPICRI
jgi:hypothetical protein